MFKVANLETTDGGHLTVQKNLNLHGAQKMEHYAQEAALGYFRETTLVWTYACITIYGNSTTITNELNRMAEEGWTHYLTCGSRGYFKKAVEESNPEPMPAIPAPKPATIFSTSSNGHGTGSSNGKNGKHSAGRK